MLVTVAKYSIEWRVTDQGVAYRYNMGESVITDEVLELNFNQDPTAYMAYSTNQDGDQYAMAFQNTYTVAALSEHPTDNIAFLPVTLDCTRAKVTIMESDLLSYPGLWVRANGNKTLSATFAKYPKATDKYPWRQQTYVTDREQFIAKVGAGSTMPWRIIAIAERDEDMLSNTMVWDLASESRVGDTSWIKPGKVAWDWWNDWNLKGVDFQTGINMPTYKYYIDFASRNNIEYVVLDEGWYESKGGDMLRHIPELNLEELITYAAERNVGIILWCVFNVLDEQLEQACEKYSAMGIKGFKVDFLDRDDQTAAEMECRIAEKCAEYKLLLDYHGVYKPTGLSKTYPNILNYEAVFGQEEMRWSEPTVDMPLYDVTFPFIRMQCGSVDYTPGAMRNANRENWQAIYREPMSMGTRCHQLACYIVHESPLTMLCDAPTAYEAEPECTELICSIPNTWDASFCLDGKLGEYIVMCRRKGDSYYIAGQTNWSARDITLDFSFLPEGEYEATLFADGANSNKVASDYKKSQFSILGSTFYSLHCAEGGGFVLKLTPKEARSNVILPGYFADPTIKKFGDKYYIYSTTDGSGAGFGPAQVWVSDNLVDWELELMNWPTSHWIWAPDVLEKNNKYYYFYCQPCQIHCGVSDSPTGPWRNILGEEEAVLVPDRFVENAITLDPQSFIDDDGSVYLYWGTWGIYKGFGCGAGKMTEDLKGFETTRLIPNTEATDFFEAPYVMKHNGLYYMLYSSDSCHDETYHIQYATAEQPLGPYTYRGTILETSADGRVHGPGHNSVLEEDGRYYIAYHQHDRPRSTRGFHRQVCLAELVFEEDGAIRPIVPELPGELAARVNNGISVYRTTASSYYDEYFVPENATDGDYATLWKPRTTGVEWLQLDLGEAQQIEAIATQWEYPTQYYQYTIETSNDGINWALFADRRNNKQCGSPMVDAGNTTARYIRITYTGGEKVGYGGSIWNVKVLADSQTCGVADSLEPVFEISNFEFTGENWFEVPFNNNSWFRDNPPFTIDAWVTNEDFDENEIIVDFTSRSFDELEKLMVGNGYEPRCGLVNHFGWFEDTGYDKIQELKGQKQHIYITFDGRTEYVYLNGELITKRDIQLMIKPSDTITLGAMGNGEWPFTGTLHSLKLYDQFIAPQQ